MIGLSLLMATGCVMSGSKSDSFATNDRITFKTPQGTQRVVSEPAKDVSRVDKTQKPDRSRTSSSLFVPGHSNAIDDDVASSHSKPSLIGPSQAAAKSTASDVPTISSARRDTPPGGPIQQTAGTESRDNNSIATAHFIGSTEPVDAKSNTIVQLQGVEFPDETPTARASDSRPNKASTPTITSATTPPAIIIKSGRDEKPESRIPLWAHRPMERAAEPVAPVRNNKLPSVEPLKQMNHAEQSTGKAVTNSTGPQNPLPWQEELEQLIARVEQQIAASKGEAPPELLRRQTHLRLLYLMAQRQEEALTAIPGAEPNQQEYWQHIIWAMSNSLDTAQFPDAADRAAQTVPPLSAALRQMREEASLSIKNMAFCRKISYFGNYERFPRNEFTPGYEVLLYTEIENFVSSPTVDGEYRTSLKSQLEILDSKGRIVWTKNFPPTEDLCRNARRDYFHNYQFHIPEDLSTGTYSLKLTIVDELSRKRTTNSLNFVLK